MLVKVADINEIKPGQAKTVSANDKRIAIFNVNGKFYATDNKCAHRGGPLGDGTLENNVITCPWHGYKYTVENGSCLTDTKLKVASYKIIVKDNDIMVEI